MLMKKAITTVALIGLAATIPTWAQSTTDTKQAPAKTTATATTPTATTAAPSADAIVDKYVQALGGKAAIEKITSTSAKGTFDLPAMGVSGTVEMYRKAPNKEYLIVSISGFGDVKRGYDGANA